MLVRPKCPFGVSPPAAAAPRFTKGVAADLRMRAAPGRPATAQQAEYPRIADGVRGVRFIEKTVASSASHQKWTLLR